jgi:uncharacterized membrane protein HdeD (DUF308 family)
MKKYTPAQLVRMLAAPALMVLLGLVLLFSPDTASALVGKMVAWCCLLAAAALGVGVIRGDSASRNNRITWVVVFFAAGIWMLMNPLTIARILGRLLGIALLIRGGQKISGELQNHGGKIVVSPGFAVAAVTVIAGLILVVLPLATSRLVFNLVGIVLICVGIAQGMDNIRGSRLLEEGSDPNIIDVEKV